MHDPSVIPFKEYRKFPPCFKLGGRSLSSHLPVCTFLLNKELQEAAHLATKKVESLFSTYF